MLHTRIFQQYLDGHTIFDKSEYIKTELGYWKQVCPECLASNGDTIDYTLGMECTTLIKCECGKWYLVIS